MRMFGLRAVTDAVCSEQAITSVGITVRSGVTPLFTGQQSCAYQRLGSVVSSWAEVESTQEEDRR